jgi:ribosome-binding protein aMBF1 (putative translation factor)
MNDWDSVTIVGKKKPSGAKNAQPRPLGGGGGGGGGDSTKNDDVETKAPTHVPMKTGHEITEARAKIHMSRKELAVKVGMTEADLGLWENGKAVWIKGSGDRLAKIERTLQQLAALPKDGKLTRPK